MQASTDLLKFFLPDRPSKFGMKVFLGAGQIFFTCRQFEVYDGNSMIKTVMLRRPEFVYFFGEQIYYQVQTNLFLVSNLSIHQLQNDTLDNFVETGDFDYYLFLIPGYCINLILVPGSIAIMKMG